MLYKAFLVPHNFYITKKSQHKKLRRPLGDWSIHSKWFRRKWKTYLSPTTKAIITKDINSQLYTCNSHIRNSRNSTKETSKRRMIFTKQHKQTTIIPHDIIPIDCLHEKSFIQIPGFSNIQTEQEQPQIKTWNHYINTLQS